MSIVRSELMDAVHICIKDQIRCIINDEILKANEEVQKRISNLLPEVTTSLMERVGYSIDEKQIIFTIKTKT